MIERSQDYRRIKKLMQFEMMIGPDIYYLVEHDGEDLGIWYAHPWRDGAALHVNMTEKCRGARARESGKAVLEWIWKNTPFRKVYGVLPTERCPAMIMAVLIGMKFLYSEQGHRVYGVEYG